MSDDGESLPDEISLSRDEAALVLFALDEAAEQADPRSATYQRISRAAQLIVEKFLPDLPEL